MISFICTYVCIVVLTCRAMCFDNNQTVTDDDKTITFTPIAWYDDWTTINMTADDGDSSPMATYADESSTTTSTTTIATYSADDVEMSVTLESENFVTTTMNYDKFMSAELSDSQYYLLDQIEKIFCSIQTLFLYIYIEYRVSTAWADSIVQMLSECSSGGVVLVRYHIYIYILMFS